MILPNNRYSYSGSDRRKKTRFVLLLVLISVIGVSLYALLSMNRLFPRLSTLGEDEKSNLETLWEQQKYSDINAICEEILLDEPLQYRALIFHGLSFFYRGAGQIILEDQLPLFNKAILYLRKALLSERQDMRGEVEYILGKAYLQKGKFYTDLSIKYLEKSIDSGYIDADTYKYIGLAYSQIGYYEQALGSFIRALDTEQSAFMLLTIAQTYYNTGDLNAAEEFLLRALNASENIGDEQKTRFLLGKIYLEQKNLVKAQEQYESILKKNPDSADAHYFLGEVYEAAGQDATARFEWRKALSIDPTHHGAKLKLY